MNQKHYCSLRLKTLESPSQGGYHLRESPSLPAAPTCAGSGCGWSLCLHLNSCKPWFQTSLPSCGKLPPSLAPQMWELASPQQERGMPVPSGERLESAHHPSQSIHHVVNVVKSHYWGWRKKRGGWFTSERFPGTSQILGDLQKVRRIQGGWAPHASPLLPCR